MGRRYIVRNDVHLYFGLIIRSSFSSFIFPFSSQGHTVFQPVLTHLRSFSSNLFHPVVMCCFAQLADLLLLAQPMSSPFRIFPTSSEPTIKSTNYVADSSIFTVITNTRPLHVTSIPFTDLLCECSRHTNSQCPYEHFFLHRYFHDSIMLRVLHI